MVTKGEIHSLAGDLLDIKKLLVMQLLAMGWRQTHIAAALGVSDATLSRMLPKGLSKVTPKSGGIGEIGSAGA